MASRQLVMPSASTENLSDWRKPGGWRRLCILFVLALLFFLPIRWHPGPWLHQQMTAAAGRYGMTLDYRRMGISGFTVRLRDVRIGGGAMAAPLSFNSIRLAPAWMSLLQAKPAVHVILAWQGVQAEATVSRNGRTIILNDLQVGADAHWLTALAKWKLPVQVAGRLRLTGVIRLDAASGRPLTGAMHCLWRKAAANLVGKQVQPEVLGDYVLSIYNNDPEKSWQWTIDGGAGVIVKGQGTLATRVVSPRQWLASGHIELSSGQTAPVFLKALLHQSIHFGLAGPLARLRLKSI